MPSTLKQFSRQGFCLVVAMLILVSCLMPSLTPKRAEAAYHQAYIQATIDTSIWEILAGVVDTKAGWFEDALEYQRLGGTLEDLAKTDMPSAAAGLIDKSPSGSGGNAKENLVMVFPGNAKSDSLVWRTSSTSKDMARATLVRNSLLYDLNNAFKFVYGDKSNNYEPGGTTDEERLNAYRADMKTFLGHISGSDNSAGAVTFKFYSGNAAQFDKALGTRATPDEVTKNSDYVCITKDGESQYFLFRMPKGYVDIGDGTPDKLSLTTVSAGKDAKYIHWGSFATEAFINYSCDEKLAVTIDDVYSSTPGAFEKVLASALRNVCDWVTGALGLWSFDELIFNSGVRGTSTYVGGIFPASWQPLIWTFFFISEIAAIVVLLYAIIFNIGKKALSTVNPVMRANAIDQIQYLFVVAIALGLLPIALQLLIGVSADITGLFVDALGKQTATDRFAVLASNSGGLGAVLTYCIYLGAVIYFNIFYGIRAITISLLIILGPIFIAFLGVSENKRGLAVTWAKELAANLFIQPLQALLMCFILMVPATGRAIDAIIMAYAMIPLTNMIRGIFFGNAGGLGHQLGDKGKQWAGRAAGRAARTAGSVAAGGIAGGVAAGAAAVSKPKTANGAGGEAGSSSSGGSEGASASGGTAASGRQQGSAGVSAASGRAGTSGSVSGGSQGTAQNENLSAGKTTESTGVSDSAKQGVSEGAAASSVSGGSSGGGSRAMDVAKGVGMTLGAVGLGAAGGAMAGFNRRVFGMPPSKGGGTVTQLSSKMAGAANAKFHGQPTAAAGAGAAGGSSPAPAQSTSNPMDDSVNPYTQGFASRRSVDGGGSDYHVSEDNLQNAGIDRVQQGSDGSATIDYNMSTLNGTDAAQINSLQSTWQSGDSSAIADLKSAGIQDVQPIYQYQGGQETLSGVSVTADQAKMKSNFGIDTAPAATGGRGVTMTVPNGGRPSLAPQVNHSMGANQTTQTPPSTRTAAQTATPGPRPSGERSSGSRDRT